jgi:hypothetical protein
LPQKKDTASIGARALVVIRKLWITLLNSFVIYKGITKEEAEKRIREMLKN